MRAMPWLRNMQDLKLLTLRYPAFSGFGTEFDAGVFDSNGCQYLINRCWEPIGTWITHDAKPSIVDSPWMLILRIGQWLCYYLFRIYGLQICPLWITTTKSLVNYHTYKTTNCWLSIEVHFNVLSFEHLLPSEIVLIMIWLYWLSFWQIETRPCGKVERSNILALFTDTTKHGGSWEKIHSAC